MTGAATSKPVTSKNGSGLTGGSELLIFWLYIVVVLSISELKCKMTANEQKD